MSLIGTGIQTITDLSDKNYEDANKKLYQLQYLEGLVKLVH